MNSDPSIRDLAKGTTGCGDDDDIEWFVNASDSLTAVADAFTIEREHTFVPRPGHDTCDVCDWGEYTHPTPHVHDERCNGTLEHAGEILCGYPGSTGHIYCQG